MKQTLWCELGKHDWEREAIRGRKPISCPEHRKVTPEVRAPGRVSHRVSAQFAVVTTPPMVKLDDDKCEVAAVNGNDFNPGDQGMVEQVNGQIVFTLFEAASQPVVSEPAVPARQTLFCQKGQHNWTRPPQRGKKPHDCPEHAPAKAEPTKRAPKIQIDGEEGERTVRFSVMPLSEIKAKYPVDYDDELVFRYIAEQVGAGRANSDLKNAYTGRLRWVSRSLRRPSVASA